MSLVVNYNFSLTTIPSGTVVTLELCLHVIVYS